MSRIRGVHTGPERIVRRLLHGMGFRFRLHNPKLPGKPDICLPKHKTVIFVHGCFWHRHRGCANCTTPTNRREWWLAKLEGNAARDKIHQRTLRKLGWRTIVVWECETESPKAFNRLSRKLSPASARRHASAAKRHSARGHPQLRIPVPTPAEAGHPCVVVGLGHRRRRCLVKGYTFVPNAGVKGFSIVQ